MGKVPSGAGVFRAPAPSAFYAPALLGFVRGDASACLAAGVHCDRPQRASAAVPLEPAPGQGPPVLLLEDWYQKALELREGFNALEAQRQEEHEAPLLAQREAERFARDLASREQEQGYGYDLAVTVTVKVERLPRRNAAQPKGPKWAWVCVEVAFERGERSVSLDHLFGIQEIYLRLNVESERHRRDLFRAFEAWIVKQVAAGRLRWSATEDDSVELP